MPILSVPNGCLQQSTLPSFTLYNSRVACGIHVFTFRMISGDTIVSAESHDVTMSALQGRRDFPLFADAGFIVHQATVTDKSEVPQDCFIARALPYCHGIVILYLSSLPSPSLLPSLPPFFFLPPSLPSG